MICTNERIFYTIACDYDMHGIYCTGKKMSHWPTIFVIAYKTHTRGGLYGGHLSNMPMQNLFGAFRPNKHVLGKKNVFFEKK